ncbi:MAG: hypothetical protein J5802_05910 [Butyrivibrio sp.]|nr:hypothetical protein [Butyrivibrio sp.]
MDSIENKTPKTVEELRECCDCIELTIPVIPGDSRRPKYGIYKDKKTGEYFLCYKKYSPNDGREYVEKISFSDEESVVTELYRRLKEEYDGLRFEKNLKKYSAQQTEPIDPFYYAELAKKTMQEEKEKKESDEVIKAHREKATLWRKGESSNSLKKEASHVYDGGWIEMLSEKIKDTVAMIKDRGKDILVAIKDWVMDIFS